MTLAAILGGLTASLIAVTLAFLKGKSQGRRDVFAQADREYKAGRKRIDEAETGDNPSDARDRLRDRAER